MGMRKLAIKARVQILNLLCEGMSMRAVARIADVSFNTVAKLLIDAGGVCAVMHDEMVQGVKASRIQCDEIWAFNYCKQKTVTIAKSAPADAGDIWTWTGIDADSKLIVSYLVGDRSGETAIELMDDLRSRLANRVQLSTDGHRAYLQAVERHFGDEVDYAMLVKRYGKDQSPSPERKYSPAICLGAEKKPVTGNPDPKHVSTSFAERANLTMRMNMRRFTRLTNGFSKKIENHACAIALHAMFYNFVRVHQTLKTKPAMAAGVTSRLWEMEDLVEMIEAFESRNSAVTKREDAVLLSNSN